MWTGPPSSEEGSLIEPEPELVEKRRSSLPVVVSMISVALLETSNGGRYTSQG